MCVCVCVLCKPKIIMSTTEWNVTFNNRAARIENQPTDYDGVWRDPNHKLLII